MFILIMINQIIRQTQWMIEIFSIQMFNQMWWLPLYQLVLILVINPILLTRFMKAVLTIWEITPIKFTLDKINSMIQQQNMSHWLKISIRLNNITIKMSLIMMVDSCITFLVFNKTTSISLVNYFLYLIKTTFNNQLSNFLYLKTPLVKEMSWTLINNLLTHLPTETFKLKMLKVIWLIQTIYHTQFLMR